MAKKVRAVAVWYADGLPFSLGLRLTICKMRGLSQMLSEDSSAFIILLPRGSKMEKKTEHRKEEAECGQVTGEKEGRKKGQRR